MTVGPPGGLSTSSLPSTAPRARPARPARRRARGARRPAPSSRTRSRSRPGPVTASTAAAGAAVLGHVGQQLGRAEVGDGLDRGGRPSGDVHAQVTGTGAAGGQRGERGARPSSKDRRVDAAGEVAQLDDGLLGAAVRGVDQLPGPGHPAVAVARRASFSLPGPASSPARPAGPARRRAGRARCGAAGPQLVDRVRPGALEVAHPLGQRGRAEQAPISGRSRRRTARRPRGQQRHDPTCGISRAPRPSVRNGRPRNWPGVGHRIGVDHPAQWRKVTRWKISHHRRIGEGSSERRLKPRTIRRRSQRC